MADDNPDIETVLGVGKATGRSRRVVILALIAVLAAIGAWFWFARAPEDAGAAYLTTPAAIGDLIVSVTATGTVEPTNLVEISSELSGTVRSVKVDHNDTVTKGQVLAELDTDKLEAVLAHSRATLDARLANVAEAEATAVEAEKQYERTKELASRDFASTQALQAAEATYARAQAAVKVARANAEVAEADLRADETNYAKACICSSINGVILERNVDVGQIVASSLQAPVLFTIAEDLSKMELQVDVDEADVGAVKVGHKATFTVEAYQDRIFPAEIAEVRYAPQTIDGVVTYQAILSIDNEELLLRPGMTATAEITVEEIKDALLIPNAALRFAPPVEQESTSGGGGLLGLLMPRRPSQQAATPTAETSGGSRTIWVLREGAATPVTVQTGATDGLQTVLTGGDLATGDRVITDLADGS